MLQFPVDVRTSVYIARICTHFISFNPYILNDTSISKIFLIFEFPLLEPYFLIF